MVRMLTVKSGGAPILRVQPTLASIHRSEIVRITIEIRYNPDIASVHQVG